MPPKKRSRSQPSFAGKVFCFSGFRDKELQDLIIAAGGGMASTVTKAVTDVVCKSGDQNTKKVTDAAAKGLNIMTREDLESELKDPTTTPPAKKQVVAAPEPPKAARGKKAAATPAPPPPAAVALDPVAESMLPGGSVVVDGADVYDAQLSKVEGRKKVTTFLSLQLVVLPKKGRKAESYHVFSRTGEAGTPGDAEILSTFPSLSDATTEFESVFRSKTGNDWSSRSSFALKRGQFNLAAGPPPALPAAAAPSPPPAPAKRGKKAAALPPGPPALVSTPSTTQAGCIDATALALFPDADVVAHGGDIYDVALSQIDVSKNMDKYYIIQLLCCPGGRKADRYYVFVRWGKTGSNGQNQTHGPYATVEEAIEVFEEKFEEKTKNQWSDRHSFKVKKGHYNLLRVDHTSKANRRLGKGPVAKWEYYVDDHVDGKQTGWYEYSKDGMESTEELWITFQANPHMSQRVVESGNYSYLVDLVKMTQTNVSHPARKVRNIRRDYNGVVTQGTATPASSVSVTLNPPATSMFAAPTPAPVAPPVPIPVPPPPPKAPRKAAAAPPSGPPVARPVDSHCPLARTASVQVVDDYDIMLNQADIKANKNKFYRLQLLYDTARSSYHFWTRWGRVGEGGQNNLDTFGNDKDRGIAAFKKKFKDKTGENWESGPNFTPRSGKYEVIEMKTAATAAVPLSMVSNSSVVPPSKLEPKTKELMEIIFDLDMFKSAMTDIKVDLTRMPLGAITVSQLDKGYAVLKEIETMLQKKSLNSREKDHLISLSGNFYQVIPHSYPRHTRPPPIDTEEMLTEKLNMINTLKDIEVAQSVMGHAAVSGPIAENPIDAKYRQLDSDIELLDPTSADYRMITTFMNQTMGHRRVQLYNIWALRRHPEDVTFPPFEALDNHQLLWHGTNIAVVAAILKTGLRIMPAVNGGRVGRGIYLADKLEKSVSYVRPARRPDGTQFGIAFLSQAAMGRVAEITRDDGSLVKAPNGYDSVIARGREEPDPNARTTFQIDGKDVTIHQGGMVNTGISSNFAQNEYLVYREAQQRLRYIISFKL